MKKNLNYFLVIFSLLLLFPLIGYTQKKLSESIEGQIDSIFSIYKNKPGCAIAVLQNGEKLFQKGYGLANLEYEIPITDKTVFDGTSVAKQFTAACVFLLEKDGKLSLDDPIQKFFPEFPEYGEGKIKVKNLLYQTSGLRSYLAILYAKNRYFGDRIDNADALRLIMNQRNLNFRTGTRFDNSNSNYVFLAKIIEIASGKKFEEFAKEKLFDPLNMTNTFFNDSPNKVIKNRAIAYEPEEDHFVLNHYFYPSVVGDGGLNTTLEDLVLWSNNLSSGVVGGKDFLTKMFTQGNLNSGAEIVYAGGLYIQNHYDIEGLPTIRHSGEWGGFRSLYYKFLNQDVAFIILSNNANTNVWGLLDQLTPLFLANEIAEAQKKAPTNSALMASNKIKLKNKDKKRFTGNFYNAINGNLRSIELVDNKLYYKRSANDKGLRLLIVSATELVFEVAPVVKFSFDESIPHRMIFTINDRGPEPYERYKKVVYNHTELKEYENNYYSEDLNVTYQIQSAENQLRILVQGKELVELVPFSKDMFREEHFGYITFHRDSSGKINGFSRTDNTFSNLVFQVLKNT